MKKYIGCVSDYNGGVVRMLNSKMELTPHYLGGANQEGDLTFSAYDVDLVNKEFLKKNNLRFLTDREVVAFFRGENLKGEKLKKPEAPRFTRDQLLEMIEDTKGFIEDLKEKGESFDYFLGTLDRLNKMLEVAAE